MPDELREGMIFFRKEEKRGWHPICGDVIMLLRPVQIRTIKETALHKWEWDDISGWEVLTNAGVTRLTCLALKSEWISLGDMTNEISID